MALVVSSMCTLARFLLIESKASIGVALRLARKRSSMYAFSSVVSWQGMAGDSEAEVTKGSWSRQGLTEEARAKHAA